MRGTSNAAFAAQQEQRRRRSIVSELLKDSHYHLWAAQDGGGRERNPERSTGPPPGGSGSAPEPRKPPAVAPSARRATALLRQLYPTAMTLSRRRAGGVSGGAIGPASPVAGPWRKPLPQPWIRTPRAGVDQSDPAPAQPDSDSDSEDDLLSGISMSFQRYSLIRLHAPRLTFLRKTTLAPAEEAWRARHDRAMRILPKVSEQMESAAFGVQAALNLAAASAHGVSSADGASRLGSSSSSSSSAFPGGARARNAARTHGAHNGSGPEPADKTTPAGLVADALSECRELESRMLTEAREEWRRLGTALQGPLGDDLRGAIFPNPNVVKGWVEALELLRPGLLTAGPDTWGRLVEMSGHEEDHHDSFYRAHGNTAHKLSWSHYHVLRRAVSGVGLLAGSSLPDACLDPLACAMLDVLAEDLWRLQTSCTYGCGSEQVSEHHTTFNALLIAASAMRLPPAKPARRHSASRRRLVSYGCPLGLVPDVARPMELAGVELGSPSQLFALVLARPFPEGKARGSLAHFRTIFSDLTSGDDPTVVQFATWQIAVTAWTEARSREELLEAGRRMGRAEAVLAFEASGTPLESLGYECSSSSGSEDGEEEPEREEGASRSDLERGGIVAEARRVPRSPSSTSSRDGSPSGPAGGAAGSSDVGLYDVLYGTGPYGSRSTAALASAAELVLGRLSGLGLVDADVPNGVATSVDSSAVNSASAVKMAADGASSAASASAASKPALAADQAVAAALSQLLLMGRELTSALGGVGLPAAALPLLRLERCLARARDDRIEGQLLEARAEDAWLGAVRTARDRAAARRATWRAMHLCRTASDPAVRAAVDRAQGCRPGEALVDARALAEALGPGLVAAHAGTWGRLMDRVEAEAGAGGADAEALHEVCRWALKGLALLVGFEGLPRARLGLACCALGGRGLESFGTLHEALPDSRVSGLCTALLLYLCCMPPLHLFPPPPKEGRAGEAGPSPASQHLCTSLGVGNSCHLLEAARRLGAMPHELYITLASFALGCLQRQSSSPHGSAADGSGMQPAWANGDGDGGGACGGRGDGGGEPFSRGWMEAHARDVAVLCAQALAEASQAPDGPSSGCARQSERPLRGTNLELGVIHTAPGDVDMSPGGSGGRRPLEPPTPTAASSPGDPTVLSASLPPDEAVDALLHLWRVGRAWRRRMRLEAKAQARGPPEEQRRLAIEAARRAGPLPEDDPVPLRLAVADAEAAGLLLLLCGRLWPLPKWQGCSRVAFLPLPWAGGAAGGAESGAAAKTGPGCANAAASGVELGLAGSIPLASSHNLHLLTLPEVLVSPFAKVKDIARLLTKRLVEGGERIIMLSGRGVEGLLRCLQLAITVRQAMQQADRDLAVMPFMMEWDELLEMGRPGAGKKVPSRGAGAGGGEGSSEGRRSRDPKDPVAAEAEDVIERFLPKLERAIDLFVTSLEQDTDVARRRGDVPIASATTGQWHMLASEDVHQVQEKLRRVDGAVREGVAMRLALVEVEPGRPDRPLWPANLGGAESGRQLSRAARRGKALVA
ncbi:hypothetical protein HYH03_007053 [Edaphochlamys debaryana]|uniref:Uncharacterized protein n=1 Tax=Edaphochlamys debaryana TaxID=47281 RepID=A0A835Y9E8_9CHLO|nr:hypothetical protein HYH03_007053 [Edaphochlamys debaryana]|eukprot:KAG2494810.1 hypothetical protein HYH03_007053 [Edaphochlamys debaryana]